MDPQQLQEYLATEHRRVVGAVTLVCGNSAIAEDAVQEALARAVEKTAAGAEIRNLAAWVTTVACNHTRTGFRRRRREAAALRRLRPDRAGADGSDLCSPPDEHDRSDDVMMVHHAVRGLPRRQRSAIVLRYFLGLDVAEVASELGIAEGTAKALLYQGRRRLERALDPAGSSAPSDATGLVARPPGPTHPGPTHPGPTHPIPEVGP